METNMSKYINRIGDASLAQEIVIYYRKYFKNYKYYDIRKKMFVKIKDESRNEDFIYMNMLIGDVKKAGLL